MCTDAADCCRLCAQSRTRRHTVGHGRANGLWHVVDDDPVSTDELFGEFARLLGADEPGRIPGWVAKFLVGEDMVRFLTNSFPTSNDRFAAEVDWEPTYPTYRKGLNAIVETWLTTGRLVDTSDGYA